MRVDVVKGEPGRAVNVREMRRNAYCADSWAFHTNNTCGSTARGCNLGACKAPCNKNMHVCLRVEQFWPVVRDAGRGLYQTIASLSHSL